VEKYLGPNWRARSLLAGVALVTLFLGVVLRIAALETSVTVVTTQTLPTPVPTSAATTPLPTSTSTPPPSPSEKTTSVRTSGSDTLELGLLGFAALFGWMSIFYNRLSKISGPGGIGIELSPTAPQQASDAVARMARKRLADGVPHGPGGLSHLYKLATYAQTTHEADQPKVLDATQRTVEVAGRATLRTMEYAKQLLWQAGSPERLRDSAALHQITDKDDLADLREGIVKDHVWDILADRALTDIDAEPSAA
jgi:hypothetical protein